MNADKRGDRRDAIVNAAFRCMAQHGYERTTTAQICAAAGVSSGTFFHYFPTKVDVLVAVLERACAHTQKVFERIREMAPHDVSAALAQWREHLLDEVSDDDLPGFIGLMGAVPDHPDVTAALEAESALTRDVLTEVVVIGQRRGEIRNDLSADRIATWLGIMAHGVLSYAAEEGPVSAGQLRPELTDLIARLIRPGGTPTVLRATNDSREP